MKPETINCPKCKRGVLFDVTPALASALGQKHVRCDMCDYRQGYDILKETRGIESAPPKDDVTV
jgi:hypothetical protein